MKNRVSILAILVIVTILLIGCSTNTGNVSPGKPSLDLVHKIEDICKRDRAVKIDITRTVQQFIPVGTSKKEAVLYLKQKGFKLYALPLDTVNRLEPWVAVLENHKDLLGFYEYRLFLAFQAGKAKSVGGFIFYHGL